MRVFGRLSDNWPVAAAGLAMAGGMAAAFYVGQLAARPGHVEETHTRAVEASKAEVATKASGAVAATATASAERTAATVARTLASDTRKARTSRRVEQRPDGTTITEEATEGEATVLRESLEAAIEKARDDARRELAASYEDEVRRLEERLRLAEASRRVETTPAPRWAVGAFATRSLDGRTGWGPEAGLRVVGPVWLGVGVDVPARAAMVRAWATWR